MDTSAESTTVPIGLAAREGAFAGGVEPGARFIHRDHENVVSRHRCAVGSHHAVHQVPDVLVTDVCRCCGLLADRVDI